jgi:hypothetical protein
VNTVMNSQQATMTKARGTKREGSRISNAESDWHLHPGSTPVTRTRGGGKRRNVLPTLLSPMTSPDDEFVLESSSSDDEDEEDELLLSRESKPLHQRVIVKERHIETAIEAFSRCPECNGPVKADCNTVCITTAISVSCKSKGCDFVGYTPGQCAKTTMHEGDNYERMTDYALNVLYVIGFISMGDSHTEGGRLLGLCGLPNDTTMKSRSFGIIEERIGPYIRKLCKEIITKNLAEEVRLSMEAKGESVVDFDHWKASLTDASIVLDKDKLPKIACSYDMAWQQKGSGHQYNSMSGHGSFFGALTRRIVGLVVKSKMCCTCNASKKKDPHGPVAYHECWKNHVGSSGSMESAGAVELLTTLYDQYHVIVERLCCDDDSSIRADCKWDNVDYLKNNNTTVLPMVKIKVGINKGKMQVRPKDKGLLPGRVPEPFFVADPNHRCKLVTGELIGLATVNVANRVTMTRMDATLLALARTLVTWQGPSKIECQASTLMPAKLYWSITSTIMNTVVIGARGNMSPSNSATESSSTTDARPRMQNSTVY